ncbi:MAG: tetratricopeptide repeat protein [Phycisphaerae bacterium]|nr:tetratricopeptide repeat protein [Phycisphaerae bacterium]
MASYTEAGVDLFGSAIPSPEDLKRLCEAIHSSEINRNAFSEELEKHLGNSLAAGIGLVMLGRSREAIDLLKKAPACTAKFLYQAYGLDAVGEYDKALVALDEAGKHGLDALAVTLEKTAVLRHAGRLDDAETELKKGANFQGVNAEYHLQRGKLSDARGDYEIAMDEYTHAIDLAPDHAEALFRLAYAYDLRGDEDEAIHYYRETIRVRPSHVNALLNLAVLYEDECDYDRAEQCVDTVLASHPNHKRAQMFQKDIDYSRTMIYDEEKERSRDRRNKILEIPITDFELSVRSRNCLKKMNINTLGDLLRITEAELLSYKNFGETSLMEIKRILDTKNLHLGMAIEDKDGAFSATVPAAEGANPEILAKPVEDLDLSVRSRRAMVRLNLKTIGELIAKTEAELLGCKNFGVTSLNEVKERLGRFGLSLRRLD